MSFIYEAPVFQITYDLLKDIHLAKNKFSKTEKYALGEKLEQSVLAIILSIITAGRSKNEWRIAALNQALQELEKTKILMRLAWDMDQLSQRRMIDWQQRVSNIGQQLGAWRKSI